MTSHLQGIVSQVEDMGATQTHCMPQGGFLPEGSVSIEGVEVAHLSGLRITLAVRGKRLCVRTRGVAVAFLILFLPVFAQRHRVPGARGRLPGGGKCHSSLPRLAEEAKGQLAGCALVLCATRLPGSPDG